MSTGYHRLGQPNARTSLPEARGIVASFVPPDEIAAVIERADPFLIDGCCPHNAGGPHHPIASCGSIVCAHCAAIFWG